MHIYTCTNFLEGKQITAAEKMWYKSHHVYPAETTQISSLGRLQKKLLEHNDCLYGAFVLERRVRKPPIGQCSKSAKLIINKLSNCYSNGSH